MTSYNNLFRQIGIKHAINSYLAGCLYVARQPKPNFDLNLVTVFSKALYYHLRLKKIFAADNTSIRGLKNITTFAQSLLVQVGLTFSITMTILF